MPPVSQVFHTVVTVKIARKMTSHRCVPGKVDSAKNTMYTTITVEAQFQIEAPDPYPLNKQRTDLGMQVVLSAPSSVAYIDYILIWNLDSYSQTSKFWSCGQIRAGFGTRGFESPGPAYQGGHGCSSPCSFRCIKIENQRTEKKT